jgi:hypothetical protein
VLALFAPILLLIPYINDANYIISHGRGETLPLYVAANAVYVFAFAATILKVPSTWTQRLIFLGSLFAAFLVVHFTLYLPMFPEFQWT